MFKIKNVRSEYVLGHGLLQEDELHVKFEIKGRFDYLEIQGILNDIMKMLGEKAEVVNYSPG